MTVRHEVRSLRFWRARRRQPWTCGECGALVRDEAVALHAGWHFPPTEEAVIPRANPSMLEGYQHKTLYVDDLGAVLPT